MLLLIEYADNEENKGVIWVTAWVIEKLLTLKANNSNGY
jgi:hypothetical protein